MKRVDDFRLRFGKRELVPIIIGGMGVDISSRELAWEAARLGGIGHISDAMLPSLFPFNKAGFAFRIIPFVASCIP